MSTMRLILVRHGETTGNTRNGSAPMIGHTDVSLTEQGWREAVLLQKRFAAYRDCAAVYTSPLRRARHTAEVMTGETGLSVTPLTDLAEIDCGRVDGVPVDEVQRAYPELWETNLQQRDDDFRWPGGESYRELRVRSLRAIEVIATAHSAGTVVAVTHAGVIAQILGAVHGLPPARWECFRPGNCSETELRVEGGHLEIVRFDDRRHLAPVPAVTAHLQNESARLKTLAQL